MARYSFTTLHQLQNKACHQCITIEFEQWLPEEQEDWQNPERGSLKLVSLLDAFSHTPIPLPDTLDLIAFRRYSWAYIERRQLGWKQDFFSHP